MTMVERTGELLARQVGRRRLVNRAAAAVFGVVAAWTVEGIRPPGALAGRCALTTDECRCRYDIAPGCGANRRGCELDRSYYSTGCWCTLTCWYGGNRCGHHVCCDNLCPGFAGQCIDDTFVSEACPKKKRSLPRA